MYSASKALRSVLIAEAEGSGRARRMALITRAAEVSMRDGLPHLDQRWHAADDATADDVRAMLGPAERGRVLDLCEAEIRAVRPPDMTRWPQQARSPGGRSAT